MRSGFQRICLTIIFSLIAALQPIIGAAPVAAQTNAASLSGVAFWDNDLDGSQSLLETVGVPDATVQLFNSNDDLLAETTTGENGAFHFDSLPAGAYNVTVIDLLACYNLISQETISLDLNDGENRNDLRFAFSRNDSWCDDPLQISYTAGSCTVPGLGLQTASLDLRNATGGALDLSDLPGDELDAFLFWSGAMDWIISYGDPDISFDGQALEADAGYGPQVWSAAPPRYSEEYESWAHRVAVEAGAGQHSLSGVDGYDVYASGAALFSVYLDPGLAAQQIMIADGLDQALGSDGPSLSPGTTRLIFPFDAASTARQATLISVVGNVIAGENSRLWTLTGAGAPPHSIVGLGAASDNILGTPEDMRWDLVESSVAIPAGAEWLAVQFESGPVAPLPRLEWVAEALILPLPDCESSGSQGSVNGAVFADVDANGIFDAGEIGLSGMNLVLLNDAGQAVRVETAASDGSYRIDGLADGSYTLLLDQPSIYIDSTTNPRPLTIANGQPLFDVDFGLVVTTANMVQTFEGRWQNGRVKLTWRTVHEDSGVSFILLRSQSQNGPFQIITDQAITGQDDPAGAAYQFSDSQAQAGQIYWYQLQTQPDGQTYGPIAINATAGHLLFLPLAIH